MRRLAIRPGGIGDFIVSLPALECLKTEYFEVWAASAHTPLVQFADRVRSIASTGLDLLGIVDPPAKLVAELRGFDSIVSWYGTSRDDFRTCVRDLNLPFTLFPALPAAGSAVHAVDFYMAQARTIAACASDGIPRIGCNAPRNGCAIIHPFSGSANKNWPLEKFQSMARGLERTTPVRWCAGPEDPPLEELLAPASPGAQVVRIDNLYELAKWLAGSAVYIGNDSGITHLAAAAGAPVLALFGPTDPAVWAPRGENVRVARWRGWQPG